MQPNNLNTIQTPSEGGDLQPLPIENVVPAPESPLSNGVSYDPNAMSVPTEQAPQRMLGKRPPWRALLALAGIVLFAGAAWFFISNGQSARRAALVNTAGQFDTVQLPLDSLAVETPQGALTVREVNINGQLSLAGSLVLTPSLQPSTPQPGQLYYDQDSNLLGYYNGTEFIYLEGTEEGVVSQIGGITGQVGLGVGLSALGGQLVNTGLLSIGGQTGAIVLGDGLSLAGNVLQNNGVLDLTAGSGITITNNGGGNFTITNSGAGNGTVASSGGTAGRIPVFTASQNIEDSLVSQSGLTVTVSGDLSLANALTVTNGGTGATSLAANGVLVGNGTSAITAVTAGGPNLCLLSTAGAPIFAACPSAAGVTTLNGLNGALNIANASGAGSTITIDNASTSAKGIAQFNDDNFDDNGAGTINTAQDIHTGATPTFAGLNTNSITPSGALTIGAAGQTALLQGSTTTITSNGGGDIVLTSSDQIRLTGFDCSGFANGGTLTTDASGNLICAHDDGGTGGGVTSVNALVGDLILQGTADQIVVNDDESDTLTLSLGADVTLQGNTFNGANQLVQLNGSSQLPAVSGALLTNLDGSAIASGTVANARLVNGGELTVTAGTNLTGGGDVALGGTVTLHVTDSPTFAGDVVVEGGTATIGTTSQAGSLVIHDGNGQTTTLQAGDSTGNLTFILPNNAGNVAQCLKQGGSNQLIWDDCEGGTGGISGVISLNGLEGTLSLQGTANRVIVSDDGNDTITISAPQDIHTAASPTFAGLTLTGNITVQGGTATIGTTSQAGSLVIHDGNGQTTTLQAGDSSSSLTFILPTSAGTGFQCLKKGTGNQLIWDDCEGGGGPGGVTSVNGLIADVTIQGTASQIAVNDNGTDTITLSLDSAVTLQGNTFNGAEQLVQLNSDGELPVLSAVNLTDLNASELATGTVPSGVVSGTYAGITGVGTIATGTWQGTTIALDYGGTGATTQQGAINNLSGLTTQGDLLYHNGTNVVRLARGGDGDCLVSTATSIQWGSCLGGGAITGSGTPGAIAVFTDTDELGDSLLSQDTDTGVITVDGHLNLTSSNQFQINGVQISSANLSNDSNLAKLNASQTFTGNSNAFRNGSDSTNAFSIQNAAGIRVLTVNTTDGQLELGVGSTLSGSLVFNNASDDNTVTILTDALTDSRTILLPDADGVICLDSGNCTGVGDVLQGGNSFGTTMTIGTNDNNDLVLERNNAARLTVGANNLTLASGIDLLLQGANAFISNPQGQEDSEAFGLNATVSGDNSLAVGAWASTHASGGSTAIGTGAEAGVNGVALGYNSSSQGNAVALGAGAGANSGGIAIGVDANNTAFENSIALGREASNTDDNQLVIGSNAASIQNVVIGNGVTNASPAGFVLQGTSGSGTNVAGANVTIAAGQGTGNVAGGSILFQSSLAGSSGSSLNSLVTLATLSTTSLTLASGHDLILQGANAYISNPQTGTNTEAFGLNATVANGSQFALAVGTSSSAATRSVAVGYAADAADSAVVLGAEASADAEGVALGYQAAANSDSIAIGNGATTSASNQLVIGSTLSRIDHVVIGNGVQNNSPAGFILQATSGLNSNTAGADITIAGGQGTGSASGGSIYFQISDPVADPSGSNSDLNALATVLGISGTDGAVTLQNATDSNAAFRILDQAGTSVALGVDHLTNFVWSDYNLSVNAALDTVDLVVYDELFVEGPSYLYGSVTVGDDEDSTTAFRVLDGDSAVVLQVDTTNHRVYIGNPSADSNGALLVLDTKNTSGDPSGVNGAMYYNSNSGKFRCYQGGIWIDCISGMYSDSMPTRTGTLQAFSPNNTVDATIDVSAVPNGSWMLMTAVYSNQQVSPVTPSGWTTLVPGYRLNSSSTRKFAVAGKIKEPSDTVVTLDKGNDSTAVSIGVVYGSGGSHPSQWQVGDVWGRDGTTGTQYITVAESITTTIDNTLALAISVEATLAAEGSAPVTTGTGWESPDHLWLYVADDGTGDQIEQIRVSYKEMPTAGATGDATDTYANNQVNNGAAVQIGITPSVGYFVGATDVADGKAGLVPAPLAGEHGALLLGDGTWSDGLFYEDGALIATNGTAGVVVEGNNGLVIVSDGTNELGIYGSGALEIARSTDDAFIDLKTDADEDYDVRLEAISDGFGIRVGGSGDRALVIDSSGNVVIGSSDTTGALLILDTKTNAGDPSGVNGAMYYNSSRGTMRCYQSGYWQDCTPLANGNFIINDEFVRPDHEFVLATSGTGAGEAAVAAEQGHPGISRLSTGTTSTGYAAHVLGSTANNILFGGGEWRFETVVRVSDLSNGTNRYQLFIGFLDGGIIDGCYFYYKDDVNSGEFQGQCASNNPAVTCDTNVALAAGTWYRLTIVVNAAGSSVDFIINGTSRCQINSNIPTSRVTSAGMYIEKTAGTTSRSLDVDYIDIRGQLTTPR